MGLITKMSAFHNPGLEEKLKKLKDFQFFQVAYEPCTVTKRI